MSFHQQGTFEVRRRFSMKTFVSLYSQRSRSLWAILAVMVVMSLIVVAWGGSTITAAASTRAPTHVSKRHPVFHTVRIVERNGRYSFQPGRLTIKAGDVVVWKNASDAPHTVSSDTGVFNTRGVVSPNQTFTFTFTRAGTFKYHCNIHLYMHATILATP